MLKTQISCEIGDLIDEVMNISGKNWNTVEKAMFANGIFPDSTKRYITSQFGLIIDKPGYDWLELALRSIFLQLHINGIYVTQAI